MTESGSRSGARIASRAPTSDAYNGAGRAGVQVGFEQCPVCLREFVVEVVADLATGLPAPRAGRPARASAAFVSGG